MYSYPSCIYSTQDETADATLVTFQTANDNVLDPQEVDDDANVEIAGLDVDGEEQSTVDCDDDDDVLGLSPEAAGIIRDLDKDKDEEDGADIGVVEDKELNEKQIRMAY